MYKYSIGEKKQPSGFLEESKTDTIFDKYLKIQPLTRFILYFSCGSGRITCVLN